jgi:NADH-quinone oxidoreductase subunit L
MAAFAALLTAFYMTRQMVYVFFGDTHRPAHHFPPADDKLSEESHGHHSPHESPAVMTTPLLILAAFAVLLGFMGTPLWPWFQTFIEGGHATFGSAPFIAALPLMAVSTILVFLGLGLGSKLYSGKIEQANQPDPLQQIQPQIFSILAHAFYIDHLYAATIVRLNTALAHISAWFDRWIWNGVVQTLSYIVLGAAYVDSFIDNCAVNPAFDEGCTTVSRGGRALSLLQAGRVQGYLRLLGLGFVILVVILLWGTKL